MSWIVIDGLIAVASAQITSVCVAIGVIALLRSLVRRYCGAAAVLRLWWILPLAFAAALLPKSAATVWPQAPLLVQAIAAPPILATPGAAAAVPWREVVIAVWLLGALAVAASMVRAQRRFSARIAWSAEGRGCLPAGAGPALVGAFAPRLALPADFRARYSAAERRLIRLHEAIHLRRRDGLVNLALAVLLVLQWFNPLVHWAVRALCRDQESACDAIVIQRHPRALRTYAEALMKTLSDSQHLPLVCRWQAYHPAVERIAMLKSHRDARRRTRLAATLLIAGTALAATLSYAARWAAVAAEESRPTGSLYRVALELAQNGVVFARPVVIAQEGVGFSIAARADGAAADTRINLVAGPDPHGISVRGSVESGPDRFVSSLGRMITAPGMHNSYTIQSAGNQRLHIDWMIEQVSAAEAASPACPTASVEEVERFVQTLPPAYSAKKFGRSGNEINLTGQADSVAAVAALLAEIERSPSFGKPTLRSVVKAMGDNGPTDLFHIGFPLKCLNGANPS